MGLETFLEGDLQAHALFHGRRKNHPGGYGVLGRYAHGLVEGDLRVGGTARMPARHQFADFRQYVSLRR